MGKLERRIPSVRGGHRELRRMLLKLLAQG
jgi:hypothetical protein